MSRLSWPERIPVRWRIALTCAGLTFLILVCFAGVLGSLVGDRIRDDFNDEVRTGASSLAAELSFNTTLGETAENRRLNDQAMAGDSVIRIVDRVGQPTGPNASTNLFADLGPPRSGVIHVGRYSVASQPIQGTGAFVQYAKPYADVEATVDRLWLFLGAGVLGGSVLALLAGLTVANRALNPIRALTSQAREIQETRDPSRHMPIPAADDEIGELAETMDGMLASLDEARSERERAFERQREFVADASHELRTPLTSVQANLELLKASLEGDEAAGDEDDRHAVDSALGSTRRMSRLVSDLLLLARADAGRRSARTETDLAEVARAALRELQPLAESHTVHSEVTEEALPVEGNPDELHRLVLNLLENAVRHTPPGSTIELYAGADRDQAMIEVSDDGPGIPADIRDQVFDRFVRGEGPADTAARGGSGLGLAIVRAVAASHGGAVEAGESDRGGAHLTVRIPLIQIDAPDVGSGADEIEPAGAALPRPPRAKS
jgi:two-component system, OmpR family, sensor kinase